MLTERVEDDARLEHPDVDLLGRGRRPLARVVVERRGVLRGAGGMRLLQGRLTGEVGRRSVGGVGLGLSPQDESETEIVGHKGHEDAGHGDSGSRGLVLEHSQTAVAEDDRRMGEELYIVS